MNKSFRSVLYLARRKYSNVTVQSTVEMSAGDQKAQFERLCKSLSSPKKTARVPQQSIFKSRNKSFTQCNALQTAIYTYKTSLAYKIWLDGDCLKDLDTEEVTLYMELVASGLQTMRYEDKVHHLDAVLGWILIQYTENPQGKIKPNLRQLAALYKAACRKRNAQDMWAGKFKKYEALFHSEVEDIEAKLDIALYKMILLLRSTDHWGAFVLALPDLRKDLMANPQNSIKRYTLLIDSLVSCSDRVQPSLLMPFINLCLEDLNALNAKWDTYFQSMSIKVLAWLYKDFKTANKVLRENSTESGKPFFALIKGYSNDGQWDKILELYETFAAPKVLKNQLELRGDALAFVLRAKQQQLLGSQAPDFKGFWQLVLAASQTSGGVIYPTGETSILHVYTQQFHNKPITIQDMQEISRAVQNVKVYDGANTFSIHRIKYHDLIQFQKSLLNALFKAYGKNPRNLKHLQAIKSLAEDIGIRLV